MLAMASKTDIRSEDALRGEEGTAGPGTGARILPSGLSALIQAATSQLSVLADESMRASPLSRTRRVDVVTHSDDTGSSDGGEHMETHTLTPTIVPEPDPRKQSFPEILMTLSLEPANIDIIAFLPDDKFFAIRTEEFTEEFLVQSFAVATFIEFLDLLEDWGFSRILKDGETCSSIEVFRHPHFIRGDWKRCSRIKFGESPTEARVSALPERARIEYTMSDDSTNSAAQSKRRLSPGFISRRDSESSGISQKQKVDSDLNRKDSTETEAAESLPHGYYTQVCRTDDLRSIALSITADKLHIKGGTESEKEEVALIDRAVESATHTIVTDAIETLLRDEGHTKETYLKHEKELSRSSLPGVVSISTQLFSPTKDSDKNSPREVRSPVIAPYASDLATFDNASS
jgi:hypothetical protein